MIKLKTREETVSYLQENNDVAIHFFFKRSNEKTTTFFYNKKTHENKFFVKFFNVITVHNDFKEVKNKVMKISDEMMLDCEIYAEKVCNEFEITHKEKDVFKPLFHYFYSGGRKFLIKIENKVLNKKNRSLFCLTKPNHPDIHLDQTIVNETQENFSSHQNWELGVEHVIISNKVRIERFIKENNLLDYSIDEETDLHFITDFIKEIEKYGYIVEEVLNKDEKKIYYIGTEYEYNSTIKFEIPQKYFLKFDSFILNGKDLSNDSPNSIIQVLKEDIMQNKEEG